MRINAPGKKRGKSDCRVTILNPKRGLRLGVITHGKRVIGIISHVHDLEERIEKQIIISKTLKGSKISINA